MRYSLAILSVLLVGGAFAAPARERVEVRSTETVPFEAGGRIHIDKSFGAVEVQGWDRPEVEVTVIRRTRREYESRDAGGARANLERIRVRVDRSAGRLRILTEFPARGVPKLLRGKTNLDLRYKIKAPSRTALSISHDVGEVEVAGLKGDMDIENRIGAVRVNLAEGETYRVDARVTLGEVSSDLRGRSSGRLLSQQFRSDGGSESRRLYVRVGIGEIQIRKAGGKEDARAPIFI